MLAILSDVHGNYPALRAVLQELDRLHCVHILSLGDVAGYYNMINECLDVFRERNIINLLGNHDHYLVHRVHCPRSETVNICIQYQDKVITKENRIYLQNSLEKYDKGHISARHGGWNDPLDEYVTCFNPASPQKEKGVLYVSGHTHIQRMQQGRDFVYLNPGSVGQPRDGDPRAAFAIIDDDGKIHLKRVAYAIDEIAERMQNEGFLSRITDCLYRGTKIGG